MLELLFCYTNKWFYMHNVRSSSRPEFSVIQLFRTFSEIIIIIIMYWGSSWKSPDVFQPKIPYYAKMAECPMKNSGMNFTFIWNLEPLCIHNLAYTILLVRHGQGLMHSTCLTWDFLNTYHMFFHEAIRVCTAQVTN